MLKNLSPLKLTNYIPSINTNNKERMQFSGKWSSKLVAVCEVSKNIKLFHIFTYKADNPAARTEDPSQKKGNNQESNHMTDILSNVQNGCSLTNS